MNQKDISIMLLEQARTAIERNSDMDAVSAIMRVVYDWAKEAFRLLLADPAAMETQLERVRAITVALAKLKGGG